MWDHDVSHYAVVGPEENYGNYVLGDWAPGNIKIECPLGIIFGGLSTNRDSLFSNIGLRRGFCVKASSEFKLWTGYSCHTVWFDKGDWRESMTGGDWNPGAYKGQCADHQFIAGIARYESLVGLGTWQAIPTALLCCEASVIHLHQ